MKKALGYFAIVLLAFVLLFGVLLFSIELPKEGHRKGGASGAQELTQGETMSKAAAARAAKARLKSQAELEAVLSEIDGLLENLRSIGKRVPDKHVLSPLVHNYIWSLESYFQKLRKYSVLQKRQFKKGQTAHTRFAGHAMRARLSVSVVKSMLSEGGADMRRMGHETQIFEQKLRAQKKAIDKALRRPEYLKSQLNARLSYLLEAYKMKLEASQFIEGAGGDSVVGKADGTEVE